jgi:hypothetical protein
VVKTIGRSQVAHNTNALAISPGGDLKQYARLSGVRIMDLAGLTWNKVIEGKDYSRFDNLDEYRDMLRYSENDITLEITGKLEGTDFLWRGIENGQSLSAQYVRTLEGAGAAAVQWLQDKRDTNLDGWVSDGGQ